jgi:hypothetical protein
VYLEQRLKRGVIVRPITLAGDLPMSTNRKKSADLGEDLLSTFNIQVCANDGRLLSEYTLTRTDDDVRTLKAAENCACKNLADYQGEPLIVVISEETLSELAQVQTDCRTRKSKLN